MAGFLAMALGVGLVALGSATASGVDGVPPKQGSEYVQAAAQGGAQFASMHAAGFRNGTGGSFVAVWEVQGSVAGSTAPPGMNAFDVCSNCKSPSVAARGVAFTEGFVVAYASTSRVGIFARLFTATGAPDGGELKVNTLGGSNTTTTAPRVAALADGRFVVAWLREVPGGELTVHGQLFSSSGVREGAEFDVNTRFLVPGTNGPVVAALTNGGFVVAWDGARGGGLAARAYDAQGTPAADELAVSTSGALPDVIASTTSDEEFFMVWRLGSNVVGRSCHSSGCTMIMPKDAPVNANPTTSSTRPALVGVPGGFIVVWRGEDATPGVDTDGIRARHAYIKPTFDLPAVKGPEFIVNTDISNGHTAPSVAPIWSPLPYDGGFVAMWIAKADKVVNAQRFGNP